MAFESTDLPALCSLAPMRPTMSSVDEDVRCLREWGTDQLHIVSKAAAESLVIGRDPTCAVQLHDPHVSPRHARLVHDGLHWRIRAIGGASLRQDGSPRNEVTLHPGVEIGLGQTTLVAESERSLTLRAFCARL